MIWKIDFIFTLARRLVRFIFESFTFSYFFSLLLSSSPYPCVYWRSSFSNKNQTAPINSSRFFLWCFKVIFVQQSRPSEKAGRERKSADCQLRRWTESFFFGCRGTTVIAFNGEFISRARARLHSDESRETFLNTSAKARSEMMIVVGCELRYKYISCCLFVGIVEETQILSARFTSSSKNMKTLDGEAKRKKHKQTQILVFSLVSR